MPSDDIAISARNLTKTYRIFGHPGERVKQAISFGLRKYQKEFTALSDVSFDIRRGETVGIIGRNGSGKSTLLQLICGILKPTYGTVKTNGRISALLELGAGFNPDFTGRENVYFQGALMGLDKVQMDRRFDEIVEFAEINQFIDQPVRTYSSGMYVRLAFSVAISIDPDILVVDEALAVGDGPFQVKCLRRIDAIRAQGGTILLVTHSADQVAHHCDRAVLLDHGRLLVDGDTSSTLGHYMTLINKASRKVPSVTSTPTIVTIKESFSSHPGYNPSETRWGDRQVTITDIKILQGSCENPDTIMLGVSVAIHFSVHFHADIDQPIYGMLVRSAEGVPILSSNSRQLLHPECAPAQRGNDKVCVRFSFVPLVQPGDYLLSIGVASDMAGEILPHDRRYNSINMHIDVPRSASGEIEMSPKFSLGGE